MAKRKQWSELSGAQRATIVVGGALEVVVTAYCLRDLARRPASEVNGSKAAWYPVLALQPVGPLAYLRWGRKR